MPDEWILGDEAGWQGGWECVRSVRMQIRAPVPQLNSRLSPAEESPVAEWVSNTGPMMCAATHLWSGDLIWRRIYRLEASFGEKPQKPQAHISPAQTHRLESRVEGLFWILLIFFFAAWSLKCWSPTNPPVYFYFYFLNFSPFSSGPVFRIFTVSPEIEKVKTSHSTK